MLAYNIRIRFIIQLGLLSKYLFTQKLRIKLIEFIFMVQPEQEKVFL
jgi:hypothetical protein